MELRKKILLISILLISIIGSVALVSYNPDDLRIDKILGQLNLFRTRYRQQKIYLHTDKNIYIAGETVWMKVYLMEASSLLSDSVSKDIYVDLIDFNNNHIQSIILRNQNGFANGDLLLSDTLKEGNYQLRSYTNWMRNFDSDFFFNKAIVIKNPNYENVVTNGRLKDIKQFNRKYKRSENHKTVQFFPEGGYYVSGFPSKVAFKAENDLGQSIHIQGTIIEDKNTQLVSFESVHQGMGIFEFTPKSGRKYIAEIKYDDGKNEKFSLPEVMDKGLVMSADPFAGEDIKVNIQSNRPSSEDITFNEVIIVAQSRGLVQYVSKDMVKNAPVVFSIPKKMFPGGIVQITLFDGRGDPQCERLVFVDPQSEIQTNKIDVFSQLKNDSIVYQVKLTKPDGTPVKGNLSLAVLEALDNVENPGENIETNLLFTSDLKGRIDNPSFYFNKTDPNAKKYLDLVMLTHGWRRFVWKNIMANIFPSILYSPAEGITVAGKITRDHFGIPIPGSKVRLTILNSYNDQFETTTDRRGRFLFPNLNYEDTIDVKIEAFKPSGGKGLQIVIGDTVVPEISTKVYPAPQNYNFDKDKLKANNRRERIQFNKNYKGKPEPDIEVPKIHETPNDVIYVGEDASQYSNILQYMQGKVSGVQIIGNSVIIRGINTFYGSTDPLFLMDGIPIDASAVSSLNPNDIEYIEILKGPEAAIYGSRGANGVIAFYSRRGHFMKRGVIEFGMLGYYRSRDFYVPAYNSWNYKPTDYNIPRTLYWKPYVVTDSEGIATIRFKNRLKILKYITTIEGMTSMGEIVHYKE